jgi:hypothetical protein
MQRMSQQLPTAKFPQLSWQSHVDESFSAGTMEDDGAGGGIIDQHADHRHDSSGHGPMQDESHNGDEGASAETTENVVASAESAEMDDENAPHKISLTQTTKKFKLPTKPSENRQDKSAKLLSDTSFAGMSGFAEFENNEQGGGGSQGTSSQETGGEVTAAGGVSTGAKVDPKLWMQQYVPTAGSGGGAAGEGSQAAAAADDEGQPYDYMNMYWLDATENNGVIYLFGKVQCIHFFRIRSGYLCLII